MTVYGPRCNVHPDRTGATRDTSQLRLLVVHTSEGGEGPTSAENLCTFMTLPGDRVDPTDGSKFGASYHYVTDTDRVLPAVPDDVVAYAAAGANNDGIHICMPGKAAQARDQWLEPISRAYIRQLAAVMVDKATQFAIPLRPLAVIEIVKGAAGYCGHVDISNAYHRSDHTDPGLSFPWDVLADDIAALQEDDVKPFLWRPTGYQNVFIICGADAMHASGATCAAYGLDPRTPVIDDHPQTLKSVLAKSGLTTADLVK